MPTTLAELPSLLADRYGPRDAVAGERETLSFAGLAGAAGRWAAALRAAGVGPGERVALLAGNGPAWLAAAFGVWRARAALVPVSTFVTARELRDTLASAAVSIVVVQPRLRGHDYLAMLEECRDLVEPRRTVSLDGGADARARSLESFLAAGAGPVSCPDPGAEATACVLYTSGTTGRPKGVELSHRAILATVAPTAARSGLDATDELLSTLPLFWVAGLVIRALPTLFAGSTLHLLESFTPDALLDALDRRPPTALHLRPPQVADLLAHPRFERRLLARVLKGNGRTEWFAGALPDAATFITGYGMTEMSGYVTALDVRDPPEVRATQGRPLPGVEIRIVGSAGEALPAGETGHVHVRGPGLFSGYRGEPPGTGLVDGWFQTGDLGRLDANGAFHFAGRTKDLLRVKGINVSPVEVENVLASHPRVRAAYVVGLPAGALEQRVVALVVADAPGDLEAGLRALVADALSHYKRPEAYVFLRNEEVPLGGTSKPLRAELARIAAAALGEAAGR